MKDFLMVSFSIYINYILLCGYFSRQEMEDYKIELISWNLSEPIENSFD